MNKAVVFVLLACCALSLGMSKKPKFSITVHSEGSAEDNPRTIFKDAVGDPPQMVIFHKVPEFSQQDVAAFHAFPATNGNGYGVALKLDFRGAGALEQVTRLHQGELLRTMVNGVPVDFVTIDKPVADGIFTIWEGIPETIVQEMGKKWPPISRSRSAAEGMDMTPTTKKEKRKAMSDARSEVRKEEQDAKKKAAEDAKKGAPQQPAAPAATTNPPTTSQLPVEGGAPGTYTPPVPPPPLPQP